MVDIARARRRAEEMVLFLNGDTELRTSHPGASAGALLTRVEYRADPAKGRDCGFFLWKSRGFSPFFTTLRMRYYIHAVGGTAHQSRGVELGA